MSKVAAKYGSTGPTTSPASDLAIKEIGSLTILQFEALCVLRVTDKQAFQGKSFSESLSDWEQAEPGQTLGFCVLSGAGPVGMILFARGADGSASAHGLKIATQWQGRGWGHLAFQLSVAGLRQAWPEIARLTLAVDADNPAALAVYSRFGLHPCEPPRPGKHGPEHHLHMAF
ncbi:MULTISPECIES: GNAT family N-acetyltransferase [unclassified Marinovum]